MKKFLVLTTALVAGLAVGLSHADDDKGKGKGKGKAADPAARADAMIKSLDKDANGTISKEEFAAGPMAAKAKEKGGDGMIDKIFAGRDTNKDGQLDKAELSTPPKGKGGDKGKGKGKGGEKGAAKGGDKEGAAKGGDKGAAKDGDKGAAKDGDKGAAKDGDKGAAKDGDKGAAKAGEKEGAAKKKAE